MPYPQFTTFSQVSNVFGWRIPLCDAEGNFSYSAGAVISTGWLNAE